MLYRKHVRTDKPSDIPEIEVLGNPIGSIGTDPDDHRDSNGPETGDINL